MSFYRSLTFQLSLGLLCIGALILTSAYLTNVSYQLLEQRDDEIASAAQLAETGYLLESSVIDLQRNVLIYKQSASVAAINRSNELIEKIQAALAEINQASYRSEEAVDMVTRMQNHLTDYKENLLVAVNGREKRQALYQNDLLVLINAAQKDINNEQGVEGKTAASLQLTKAHNAVLAYLMTQNAAHVKEFNQHMSTIRAQFAKRPIASQFNAISMSFRRLHQTIRGYLYLTNVVLPGTANEILHLSSRLRVYEEQGMQAKLVKAKEVTSSLQARSELFILLSIVLVVIYAAFLIIRVISPIRSLTALFKRLSNNLHVEHIPYLKREDEIGQLSVAASVFHNKNLQTNDLLERTKELVIEQKELNKELEVKRNEAEQATVSKSLFLANMSHEIRTPMNGIIGLVELLKGSNLAAEQQECIDKISYSSGVLLAVINDILDFSKIEAGKLDIEEKEFALGKMLDNVLASVSLRAAEKNLYFRCISPVGLTHLVGDEVRITQIILNLCNNAIKFTALGGVELRISVNDSATGEIILNIDVEDTGIGMTQEHQNDVFEQFSQADVSTSRRFGGTGLGLAIVKQLCELMNGSVSVHSQKDKGSTFSVFLRLKHATERAQHKLPEGQPFAISILTCNRSNKTTQILASYLKANKCVINYLNIKELSEKKQQDKSCCMLLLLDHEMSQQLTISDIALLQRDNVDLCVVLDKRDSVLLTRVGISKDILVLEMPFTYGTFYSQICKLFKYDSGGEQALAESEITLNLQGRVLLVEDNAVNQMVAEKLLSSLGLETDIAEDGRQAVDKLSNTPYAYDLIFMDVQMPVMDGFSATLFIRNELKLETPICGLSANAMSEDFDKAIAHGMDNFITKPIAMDKLKAVLEQYLG
ncbi:Sensor histidine kinase RcsC [Pseudoalteromonas sp. CIP111854]|uniref:histidine kinase n=1 Tax=Pseudoalteromonas holothuriae TaxID=2963714 RepID=A0A9W4QRF4_9GAMM|nr:ATP-binding protein [Pseudoalteromonas sp. CIP111854]CAH9049868.1 Sensor histidine kinase RcsC [Pseudoalteromonas sp. CIP111854]